MKLKAWTEAELAAKQREALSLPSDISIDRLIDDSLAILYREIKMLSLLSENGKLSPNDARDLRDHLKLLFDLQVRESDALKGVSDEELSRRAKAALNDD